MFESLKKYLNTFEKKYFAVARMNLYAVAVRYITDEDPKLTTMVMVARSEQEAIDKLKCLVIKNCPGKKIEFSTVIANRANTVTVDRIKKEC